MASDLQSLKILLQVRDREFARALNKNTARVDRFAKKSQKNLSRTTRGFNGLAMSMRGLLPALGAAVLIAKVKSVTAELDNIGKTADKLGLTTDALQELRTVAEGAGVSVTTFDMAMQRFGRRLAEARQGTGEAKAALEELEIEFYNADGTARDIVDVLGSVSNAMSKMTEQTDMNRIAMKLFDSEGVAMVNMLRSGEDSMNDLRAEAKRLGVVIDEDLIRKAEGAQTELDLLSRVMNAQVSTALVNLMPLILSVGRALVNISRAAGTAFSDIRAIMGVIEVGGAGNLSAEKQAIIVNRALELAIEDRAKASERLARLQARVDAGGGDIDSPRFLEEYSEAVARATADIDRFTRTHDMLLETINGQAAPPPTTASPEPEPLSPSFGFQAARRIQNLSRELELLGMTTDAQRLRRIEIEKTNLDIELQNEALATNGDITAEEQAVITGLVAAFERESLALMEATAAMDANTGARGSNVAAIDTQAEALEALSDANQQIVEDFIDVLTSADSLKDGLNDLLKMFVKLATTSFLQGLFGVAPDKQSGLASFFSDLGGNLQGRAAGGSVQAGNPYMVGENGREPFIPAQNGRILSTSQAKAAIGGGGGGVTIVQNLNFSLGVQSTVRAEVLGLLPQITEAAKGAVLDANARGGAFTQSLKGG
ncbi:MAG: hypothetical protein L3J33_03450 [Rhodobacteraceae bacterium]|nr:hypothetical protein [Paracoccaceae bacterium]